MTTRNKLSHLARKPIIPLRIKAKAALLAGFYFAAVHISATSFEAGKAQEHEVMSETLYLLIVASAGTEEAKAQAAKKKPRKDAITQAGF